MDWHRAFGVQTAPLEIIIRGSIVYLALYIMLRVVLKRQSGSTGITDLLVIVLIADAAQNAMSAQYTSITDGLILVATIIGWSYLLDYLAFRFAWLGRLIQPSPLPLVRNGGMIRRNMRRELITEEELRSQLRQQGIDDVTKVKAAFMEPDGQVSVVTGEQQPHPGRERETC